MKTNKTNSGNGAGRAKASHSSRPQDRSRALAAGCAASFLPANSGSGTPKGSDVPSSRTMATEPMDVPSTRSSLPDLQGSGPLSHPLAADVALPSLTKIETGSLGLAARTITVWTLCEREKFDGGGQQITGLYGLPVIVFIHGYLSWRSSRQSALRWNYRLAFALRGDNLDTDGNVWCAFPFGVPPRRIHISIYVS